MITKSQVISNLFEVSATNILSSIDTEYASNSTTYLLARTFTFRGGLIPNSRIKISYEITQVGGGTAYGQLYLNSTSLQIDSDASGGYVTKTYTLENANLKKGDQIHLYIKHSTGGAQTCSIKNLRIYGAISPVVKTYELS